MKALIFNSGIGKRMGELTKNSPKSMVKLLNGETIFERQIRILSECGIKDFVITTGPFEDQLVNVTKKDAYKNLSFKFVHNDLYAETNYIYSCYLAKKYLDDDLLTLHGDLVFNKNLVIKMLKDQRKSLGLINPNLELPEKDFKGRVVDGKLREVSINIFDKDCFTFQPLYKLSRKDAKIWIDSIIDFIENKNIKTVYAENAFNEVSSLTNIELLSYEDDYINEIDNVDDYNRVTKDIQKIDYKEQEIRYSLDDLEELKKIYNLNKPLFVIDSFLLNNKDLFESKIKRIFGKNIITFSDFKPNPLYDDVLKGLNSFKTNNCDSIIAIGGGSAIDTAKAIKLFLPLDESKNYLEQKHEYINLKLIAIPTTAGTGSESTRYSVVYYNGEKQSLTDDMILPDIAILDKYFIITLPINQRKATIFDALCHSIESIWSINATKESQQYATSAIKMILANIDSYLSMDNSVDDIILKAANLAGKAINISQTTAAHAMSYKITSLYGIPHGIAVAVCLPQVWSFLIKNQNESIKNSLQLIDNSFNCLSDNDSLKLFTGLLEKNNIKINIKESDLDVLVESVNLIRLKNYPLQISKEDLKNLYYKISY